MAPWLLWILSASPWKIPLWIFISAKLLPPAVSSTLQVFMVFSIKFMTSCDILYILRQYYFLRAFPTSVIWWPSLSVTKSSQVSRTLLSILTDLNNAVVWMILIRFLISNSSSLFTNLWGLFQGRQLQMVSPSLFCFIAFFSSLARSEYLSLFSFDFHSVIPRDSTIYETAGFLVFLISTRSGLLAGIRWSVFIF